jgi:hypothetical protein
MAIGWVALLKAVPWGEVARKAPEIAESAKKLWSTVARKPPQPELEMRTVFASDDEDVSSLKQRLAKVEATNAELHNQMLTTSELIKALADQNTQLINRIELNRIRTIRLAAFAIVIGLIAAYCLYKIILR